MYEQATIIVETQLLLTKIRRARASVLEEMRTRVPPPKGVLPFEDIVALVSLGKRGLLKAASALRENAKLISEVIKAAQEKANAVALDADTGLRWLARHHIEQSDPSVDQHAAFEYALPRLRVLDRYERRALSRRRKAIERLLALRHLADIRAEAGGPRGTIATAKGT